MRFRQSHRKSPSLDTVALTDIVMNLFLFFFITFNFFSTFQASRETAIQVNLPMIAPGKAPLHIPAVHQISLTKSGDILWDDSKVTGMELRGKLTQPDIKSKPIPLRSDREASVQKLVDVLEIVRDTGATNVSLQTAIDQNHK
ncbi:MAG: biopolymer transporter ExbD [Candidatus Omnitrophica bacterium]|nr:biopolymer transporter ExbD [Candidatus Omnitrophota bacterium]